MHVQKHAPEGIAEGAYSLQVENPRRGSTTVETFRSMPAVVARAAELIRAGYNVGIWSAISLEKH